MKRLLTLTLCLITTASTFDALADEMANKCNYLRNRPQDYQECLNGWDGTSNKSNASTPWWKNYDPNTGSAPAEQPQNTGVDPYYARQREEAERKAAEAKSKLDQGLAIFDVAVDQLDALNQKGNDYLRAGRAHDALNAFTDANNILEKYTDYHFGIVRRCQTYENIGHALVQKGSADAAEAWFKKSAVIVEDPSSLLRGEDNYHRSLNALATFYESQGRWAEAGTLHKRRFEVTQKRFGSNHPEAIKALKAMTGLTYLANLQRQRADSPAPEQQADDWKTAWNTLSDEAVKLSANRKFSPAMAVEKAREALALAEKHDGPKRYAVASSQQLLAQMLWRNKQTYEAEALLKTAISTFEKGTESKIVPALSETLATLAKLHVYQKRNAEAEPLYKRALALHEKQADPNLFALIESLTALENFYFHDMRKERSAEYAAVLQHKLALQEKHLGPEHLDVAETLRSLASHLYLQGMNSKGAPSTAHYNESETHYKRALAILEKAPSAKAKRLLRNVFSGLRLVYRMTDRNQEAEQLEQREKAFETQG